MPSAGRRVLLHGDHRRDLGVDRGQVAESRQRIDDRPVENQEDSSTASTSPRAGSCSMPPLMKGNHQPL
jgi:hypothetical protein